MKTNIWKHDLFNISVVLLFKKDTSKSKSERTKKPGKLWETCILLTTGTVQTGTLWKQNKYPTELLGKALFYENTKVCSNCSILSDPLKSDVCRLIRAARALSHPLWSGHRSSTNQEPACCTGSREQQLLAATKPPFHPAPTVAASHLFSQSKRHWVSTRFRGEMSAFVSCCLSNVVCLEGSEAEGGGKKEKEETKWRVCQKCGWKGRWLTTAARAAALIPLGLLHCSTLSLEDASVVTGENKKACTWRCFPPCIHGGATRSSGIQIWRVKFGSIQDFEIGKIL